MIARSISALLLLLAATPVWAQPPATDTPTPAMTATAPSAAPTNTDTTDSQTADTTDEATAPEDTTAQPDEEAGGDTSGPVTSTDKIVDRFMELDTDASEGVSFDEYMAMVQQRAQDRFKGMDANEDGEVTADEYRQFWQSRMAQWYRLKR